MPLLLFDGRRVWENVRSKGSRNPLGGIILANIQCPRWSVGLYKIKKACLPTSDKIKIWYPTYDNRCVLCKKEVETHEHLFLRCEFNREV